MSTTTSRQGLTLPALTDTADITVITGDLTTIDTEGVFLNIANTAASGMTLDMSAAGANAHIVPNGAGITPTTDGAIAYDTTAEALVVGSDGSTLTIATTTTSFGKLVVSGLTGATAASRYVGATTSGAPASGTFAVGDYIIDQTGSIRICVTAGSPGTWISVGTPSGSLVAYGAGTTDPSGWFLADGRAVSRTTYASLYTAVGTSFGTGDGSTTFNLPDLRGRTIFGADNMGTSAGAASRFTANNTLGSTAQGEYTHTLTATEMPSHSHNYTTIPIGGGGSLSGVDYESVGGSQTNRATTTAGSGGAHNIIPLSQIVNWIIKQ